MTDAYRRNLVVMVVFQAIVAIGYSFAFPFMPLYLHELGVTSDDAVKLWGGAIFAGSSVTMAAMGPVWGYVADRFGPRLMVYRAIFSVVVVVALMAVVTGPEQLLVLRVIQGAFTGVNAAALTLMALTTPKEQLGFTLGLMQTAAFAGVSFGPLLGGFVADRLGYRAAFGGSALVMLSAGIVFSLGFVGGRGRGHASTEDAPTTPPAGIGAGLWEMLATQPLLALVLLAFLAQASSQVLGPILPLYVRQLADSDDAVASTTGLIVGATALLGSISAAVLGRLGDRAGHVRILLISLAGAAVCYVPQAFVTSNGQLLVWQALTGLCWGGVLPSTSALLGLRAGPGRRGTAYGVMASANSLGSGAGPLAGSLVAVWLGIPAVFIMTALVVLLIGGWSVRVLARPIAD